MLRILTAIATILTLTACGEGEGGGLGTPPTPSPMLTNLSLAPATDLMKIKGTETFTANAAFSDGTSRSVEATWGSDNTAVATVTTGRVTGVSPGQATIFAEYQGQRATRLLRVVPDYHGRWTGELALTACVDEGDWEGVCDQFDLADLVPLTLSLTQTRDTVTGTADPDPPISVQGTIGLPGHLVLQGSRVEEVEGIPVEFSFSNWETLTADNERMSGHFSLTLRAVGIQGSFRFDTELRNVSKTSTTPMLLRGSGATGALRQHLSAAVRAARARKAS